MSFVCPLCDTISHNPNDETQRYCARCHVFFLADGTSEPATPEEWAEILRLDDQRRTLMKMQKVCEHCGSDQMQLRIFSLGAVTPERQPFSTWTCRVCKRPELIMGDLGRST